MRIFAKPFRYYTLNISRGLLCLFYFMLIYISFVSYEQFLIILQRQKIIENLRNFTLKRNNKPVNYSLNENIFKKSSNYAIQNKVIPAFIPFRSSFLVSPKYGISACRIQKNLSTILLNLFCYLNNPKEFLQKAKNLYREYDYRISMTTCNSTQTNNIANISRIKTKLLIIRDPVERFLSAFVDKCINEKKLIPQRCYHCNENMLCVLKKQYRRLVAISKQQIEHFSYEDRHFAPMSWFCELNKKRMKKYRILKFGENRDTQQTTILEIINELQQSGVQNDTILFIRKQLLDQRTKHSTTGSNIRRNIEKEMRNNREVMKYLRLIYVNDYMLFNFTLPF